MSHTIRDKTKLLHRVSRLGGQVQAIEKALKAGRECGEVLQLIASVRGAVNGLMAEVLEEHIRAHVVGLDEQSEAIRVQGTDQLIDVVRTYLK
jgi:DNA-binding FrmR family transcriptional regulator